eukprot:6212969-Pleurochrysis_carterae.AAC.5
MMIDGVDIASHSQTACACSLLIMPPFVTLSRGCLPRKLATPALHGTRQSAQRISSVAATSELRATCNELAVPVALESTSFEELHDSNAVLKIKLMGALCRFPEVSEHLMILLKQQVPKACPDIGKLCFDLSRKAKCPV